MSSGRIQWEPAGGYWDPHLSDPDKVAAEVKNRITSLEKAREEYGVVVDPETFTIDQNETVKIRKSKG
jgi:N-methylhydantoinase B/oxoprolinase/acetone carboxylase alpha subunit